MNSYKKINELINDYNIISFDIFDTLLKRNVRRPSDIFKLVENKYNALNDKKIVGFKKLRINAESIARQKSLKEDILLSEIYDELDIDPNIAEKLMKIEYEIEKEFLIVNKDIKPIYDSAVSKGKRIFIVSDMYMPKEFVERVLHDCGYDNYSKLYISSDVGYLKSTGSLFKYILKSNNLNPKDILHIGDSKKGDWLRPKVYGIRSIKLNTYNDNLIYADNTDENISGNIMNTFINNNYSTDRYFQIGMETLGPVIFGFCKWLNYKAKEKNINKLLFFSRDGYLLKKAYDIIYPNEKTEYLYVSRRSLTVPVIFTKRNKSEVFNTIPLNRFTKMTVLFKRLGLNIKDYKPLLKKYGFDEDSILSKEEYLTNDNFDKVFTEIKQAVYSNSQKEYENFSEYIKQYNLNGNIGIVDIGWKGTMQKAFKSLLDNCKINYNLTGFYLGTLYNNDAYGYIFNGENDENFYELMGFTGLFELLFSGNHGSVKRYMDQCKVEFYDFEFNYNEKSRNDYESIKKIQSGALNFVEQFSKSLCEKYVTCNREIVFKAIKNFGINTKKEDLRGFGNMYFFDNENQYLAKPDLKHLFNIKNLKEDLSLSTWKVGYLKRLMKIPFPYLDLYKFLRKRAQ